MLMPCESISGISVMGCNLRLIENYLGYINGNPEKLFIEYRFKGVVFSR